MISVPAISSHGTLLCYMAKAHPSRRTKSNPQTSTNLGRIAAIEICFDRDMLLRIRAVEVRRAGRVQLCGELWTSEQPVDLSAGPADIEATHSRDDGRGADLDDAEGDDGCKLVIVSRCPRSR